MMRMVEVLTDATRRVCGDFLQGCSLGLNVSVSRRVFGTSQSRKNLRRSRSQSCLEQKTECLVSCLGPQHLVYKLILTEVSLY